MTLSRRPVTGTLLCAALVAGLAGSGRALAQPPGGQPVARPAPQWVVPAGFQVTTHQKTAPSYAAVRRACRAR